ncbi:SpaH/EbpB family LPXTG-anchored major pilin [Corynebacterium pseudopelargi]|uniref:Fimbrial subunit type 1 n=1 Tax=Corynebacterium pseudopelargi TaxID=2080757 RepID=A0A3G6IXD8_9CORY|nr:SpaH/EbpB family LPXTG-anchored major pilin [Corynebacterium pseudopelargi]AZA10233.1 Fimbrial subunit type 1 precursor [Corynebacterium pseudopelargi]
MTTLKHRWAAALAAGAIAVTGAGASVTLAPAPAYAQQTANPTGITNESGNLHIHKFANNQGVAQGDGSKIDDTGNLGEPLPGAVFKVTKVDGVDLKTNDGWEKAARIQRGEEDANLTQPGVTKTTNSSGVADFDGLSIGLYKVEETSAPSGYESAADANAFYVTLPITDPKAKNAWLYDVHVYPKNKKQENVISKTVNDNDATTNGSKIQYTVDGKLPSATELEKVELTDLYPSDRLSDPRATRVTIGDDIEVVDGVDYNLNIETPGQAKVVFTPQGLAKLDKLSGEARKVQAQFEFTVADPDSQTELGPIKNRAMINAKGKDSEAPDPDPEDPTDPNVTPDEESPETYYGNVEVTKVGDDEAKLSGVKFDLYRCDDKDSLVGEPVKRDITTGGEGKVTIKSLHVNDWVNGEKNPTNPSGYCLVETQAAEGYALLAEPYYFEVLRDSADNVALTSKTVKNVKNNGGFQLPLTGGTGVTMLLIIGGLIMAGGALYMVRNNRRENKA